MPDKAFLDTNIIIYMYSADDEGKRICASELLNSYTCVTSLQVMNEACNVWIKKFLWDENKINEHLDNIKVICDDIIPIHIETIEKALDLNSKYGYSYYDCLMLASALEYECQIIFTEDMKDGQLINSSLKIKNPFVRERSH